MDMALNRLLFKIGGGNIIVKGEWDKGIPLIKECHYFALKESSLVITNIEIRIFEEIY